MKRALPVLAILLAATASPALALGPVDGEVTALYWLSTTQIGSSEEDSPDAGGRAELWFVKKIGISAALVRTDPEGALEGTDLEYRNLDLKWRVLSPTENNFLALGVGWQQLELANGDSVDTSGPRAVLEGRVSLVGVLYAYGRAAYLPDLDDWRIGLVTLTNGKGHEIEGGVQLKPAPFLQFFAGYRRNEATFDGLLGEVEVSTDGIVAGAGVNF